MDWNKVVSNEEVARAYLAGEITQESLPLHPDDWYGEHNIELRTGCHVAGLDAEAKEVVAERARPDPISAHRCSPGPRQVSSRGRSAP